MTDKFTASNRVKVERFEDSSLLVCNGPSGPVSITDAETEALREYFRAAEDKHLGRWRDPERPDYVVYQFAPRNVRVLRESVGKALDYMDEGAWSSVPSDYASAARAYFDAHPEPKPWQSPNTGEVWALSLDGDEPTAWAVNNDNVYMDACSTLDPKSRMITAGEKIWPRGDA